MDTISIIQIVISVLVFLGAVIGWIWSRAYKARVIAERPYPCKVVLDLQEKLEKHDTYFSKDRQRLEDLEKFQAGTTAQLTAVEKNVEEIKETTNRIFLMLVEGRTK